MIIFYNKVTGNIIGTIDGRVHTPEHMKIWIGPKNENKKLVVNWKPAKFYNKKGDVIEKSEMKQGEFCNADFEPDHPQKEIFMKLDRKPSDVYGYNVDLETKNLVKK